MLETFLDIVHIFACVFLMLVVLLQQGKGGGMGAAFGGGAAQQVFGGRGAGNILTKATAICAGIFMLTSVSLAYLSSGGDANFRSFANQQRTKRALGKGHEGEAVMGAGSASAGSEAPPVPEAPAPSSAPAP